MTTHRLSNGQRISKKRIDYLVREAKRIKLQQQFDELGYNVCDECHRNDCVPIDCAHVISVDRCQKEQNIPLELAWDLDNITIIGRRHHQKRDGLDLQFKGITS